ncbi:Mannosyl-oligosaccharide 1,2-alpha-mannosidase MNS2 [Smittium culicis]|uniref:alpha-1,2-Mannosidase n=1 Tax=Smittium culicis TaxID=133412 RepID=A0A1R1X7X1_9FUNG|nr:Mannosyl-oligosaccharide 1,2-alpha-mannosidase MNS2 [Smittium culicis]
MKTPFPGLYPIFVDKKKMKLNGPVSIGGMGDSFYEYLLKLYLLHDKSEDQYRNMYIKSVEGISNKMVFKRKVGYNLTFTSDLESGTYKPTGKMGHLDCFFPGVLALGSKELDRPNDLKLAEELMETCYDFYKRMPTGLSPEGEYGWEIYKAIEKETKTDVGYSALKDVTATGSKKKLLDSMESFFLAETLKYLYLLFSPTDYISLDDFVFNTEAHPLKKIKYPLSSRST